MFSSARQFFAPVSILSLRINNNQQIFPILQHNDLTNILFIHIYSICVKAYNFIIQSTKFLQNHEAATDTLTSTIISHLYLPETLIGFFKPYGSC